MLLHRIIGRPRGISRTVVVSVVFSVVLGVLYLMSNDFYFRQVSKMSPSETHFVSEIRLAPDKDGNCRSIKVDRHFDQIGEEKIIDCDADPTAHLGPFQAIRKNFNGQ
jgi:hypothetical protein